MNASREAYDLHNPACRANAWRRIKRGDWKRLWFIRLILVDTIENVCTVRSAQRSSNIPTARRVRVRITGEVGTVHETHEPDYSLVMIDGADRLQAYREHEITPA